ncbi:hypothetical protein CAEBREN_30599 [Caenorhabditis brenneri]|uniref:Uncharacterized protein n=1 Tax=Caenorhabditis brenneri TaxID=135651 RepID=G0NWX6_CAEBE|nr:hypothetical protein CAEBREN_30599 [Caenorhabditis brenneri]
MSKMIFDSRIATSSEYNPCLNSASEYTVANENISNEENIDVDNEEEWKRVKRKEEMIAEKRRIHNEKRRSRYEEMPDEEKQAYIRKGPSKEHVDNGQLLPTPTMREAPDVSPKRRQNILENENYIESIKARLQAMTRKERRIFIRKRTQAHIDYHQNEISNLKKTEEIRTQNRSLTSNKGEEQHDPLNLLGVTSEMQKEVIQQSVEAKDHQEEERTLLETLNVAEPYSDDLTSNVLPKTGAKSKPKPDKSQLAQRERERKDTANAAQRARYHAMTPEERTIYNKKWRDSRKEKGNAARRAKYQAMTPEERRSCRTRQTAEERRIHNENARMKYLEVKNVSRYAKNRKKPTIEEEDKKRNVSEVESQNEKEICNGKPPEHINHHPDEQLQPEKMIAATTQETIAANKFRLCGFFPLTISYDN